MHSQEEIARRKEILRNDPATKRIAEKLGVTLERFLQDIENPGLIVDQSNGRPMEERLAEVEGILTRAVESARELQLQRGQKRDGFTGEENRRREAKKKNLVGLETW